MEIMLIVVLTIQSCFLSPIRDTDNSAFLFKPKNDKLGIAYDKFGHGRFSIHTSIALELCPIHPVQSHLNLNGKCKPKQGLVLLANFFPFLQ